MGKVLDTILDQHKAFIAKQKMFFVATAALSGEGHINLSPKGTDCFRVLSPTRIAYMDLTGSGNETSAHILENGRITIMFCAFEGPPRIVRFHGRGEAIALGDQRFDEAIAPFEPLDELTELGRRAASI